MSVISETTTAPRRGFRLVRRVYLARCLVLGLGSLHVGTALYQIGAGPLLWCLLLLHGFGWAHVAYVLSLRAREPYRWEMNQLLLDAFLVASWIPQMHFNTLPSAMCVAMMAMSLVGIGGPGLMLRGFGVQVIAIVLGGTLTHWQFEPISTQLNVLSCLPSIMLYPLAIAALMFQLSKRLSQQRNELDYVSKHDGLSKLLNRRHWETVVSDEFMRGRRQCTTAALILADIDHFKMVNDCCGHAAGDEAIRRFADLILANVRAIDHAARYGGEEFAVLLPGTGLIEAIEVAERLREALAQSPLIAGRQITASFGVAELQVGFADAAAWVACVDAALYSAKQRGRDCVVAQVPA